MSGHCRVIATASDPAIYGGDIQSSPLPRIHHHSHRPLLLLLLLLLLLPPMLHLVLHGVLLPVRPGARRRLLALTMLWRRLLHRVPLRRHLMRRPSEATGRRPLLLRRRPLLLRRRLLLTLLPARAKVTLMVRRVRHSPATAPQ
jgi:hypothetical protein